MARKLMSTTQEKHKGLKTKATSSKKRAKNELKIVNTASDEVMDGSGVSRVAQSAPLKSLDAAYGRQVSPRRMRAELLSGIDRLAGRAEGAIESLLFSYETRESTDSSSKDQESGDLVTIKTTGESTGLASGLRFS